MLDVGSGGCPHPSADVLLDKFAHTSHRHYVPLVTDRPAVLADACHMPFRNKTFDFVIAFHVLEHIPDPVPFLNELQRVARAGYIETPNAIFERLIPYPIHVLEVGEKDGKLLLYKKRSKQPDPILNALEIVKRSPRWNRIFYGNPDLFHIQYFWKDKITFEVLNPEENVGWYTNSIDQNSCLTTQFEPATTLRSAGLEWVRKWNKLRKKKVALADILVCPECKQALEVLELALSCTNCHVHYKRGPLPDFTDPIPTN